MDIKNKHALLAGSSISMIGAGMNYYGLIIPGKVLLIGGIALLVLTILDIVYERHYGAGNPIKNQLAGMYKGFQLNLNKWGQIQDGSLKPKRKSEKSEIYDNLNEILKRYYILIEENNLGQVHMEAYEAIKEFTKFPEAGIQPELFQKAKEAVKRAF